MSYFTRFIILTSLINHHLSPAFAVVQVEFDFESTVNKNEEDSQNTTDTQVCSLTACDLMSSLDKRNVELQWKVNSLDQPVWTFSTDNLRWNSCSEGPCRCTPPSLSINCWRLELKEIPWKQTMPTDTIVLDLGTNNIAALHKHTFKGLTRLTQLDISDNRLEYLPETIFEELESLKYLLLARNQLQSLHSRMFNDLINLQSLDLSENQLTDLPVGIWDRMNTLNSLQLSRNRLTSWTHFHGLVALEDLDLSSNSISTLEPFRFLKKLKRLKLSENKLKQLLPTTFLGLRNLQSLTLHQNLIEDLPPSLFSDLRNLTVLGLSNNMLTDLEKMQFQGLLSLRDLDISRNVISVLRNGTFSSVGKTLDRLHLGGNMIEALEPLAFEGLGNVTWLLLENNMLTVIGADVLLPLENLTKMGLDGNDLLYVEDNALESLVKLESIRIGKNAWNCDCNILYLANWVRDHGPKVWDYQPKCRGPDALAGRPLHEMTFGDVCDGQWMSVQRIPTRITVNPRN